MEAATNNESYKRCLRFHNQQNLPNTLCKFAFGCSDKCSATTILELARVVVG